MEFKQVSYEFLTRVPSRDIKFLSCFKDDIQKYTENWYWFPIDALRNYRSATFSLFIKLSDYNRISTKLMKLFYE